MMPGAEIAARLRQAEKESAAITGFTSAIAAFGAFFIPKSFGSAINISGSATPALWGFLGFYVTCLIITWHYYTRRGGLLYDVEHARSAPRAPLAPASTPAE